MEETAWEMDCAILQAIKSTGAYQRLTEKDTRQTLERFVFVDSIQSDSRPLLRYLSYLTEKKMKLSKCYGSLLPSIFIFSLTLSEILGRTHHFPLPPGCSFKLFWISLSKLGLSSQSSKHISIWHLRKK